MGVKIILKCDLCGHEDTTFTWGEDPKRYGWHMDRNYCLCDACNKRSAVNPHEEHLQLQERRESAQQENMPKGTPAGSMHAATAEQYLSWKSALHSGRSFPETQSFDGRYQ